MKIISSILALSALLVPAAASSQESSHTTDFNLITMVGGTTTRYSLTEERNVVLPAGVDWNCKSVPVTLSADGGVYMAGFVCTNGREDLVGTQANCYTNREDYEKSVMSMSKQAAEVGVIKFIVECRTRSNDESPRIRVQH
jgi:hypothetical protein